jgi:hypothetical protein
MRLLPAAIAFASLAALASAGCSSGDTAGGTAGASSSSSASSSSGAGGAALEVPWLSDARILVSGETTTNTDCRDHICRHSENTDMTVWKGAIWLVHRTAMSQILGPNSALHIDRSTDGGKTFSQAAIIRAPMNPGNSPDRPPGRDIRDPHFYTVGDKLFIKTLTRLPVDSTRDSNVDTIAQMSSTSDGKTWSELTPIGPEMWSFWRIKEQAGVYYSAAYHDGDESVSLFSSTDGVAWTKGAVVYDVSADTPLETELTFMPSGKLLALVRMDGTDQELLGDSGRLRTKICWADPPYAQFDCPDEIDGQRLDGPLTFFHDGRLFVVARKHLSTGDRKRTALFELTGDFDHGGKLAIKEWGELPSAGDTSYAGIATIDADHSLLSWYSGNLAKDEGWALAMFDITDIWQGTLDFTKLK